MRFPYQKTFNFQKTKNRKLPELNRKVKEDTASKSRGADYGDSPIGEIPDIGDDFKSAYVPVRTFIFHLIQMPFQVDPNVPILLNGEQLVFKIN